MSFFKGMKAAVNALVVLSSLAFAGSPASAFNYRGGGALFDFNACPGWAGGAPVTARLTPTIANAAGVNEIMLVLNDNAIIFNIVEPFAPSQAWRRMTGTALFGPADRMDPRPRFRIRQLTLFPPGSTLTNATEIDLRMNIRDFSWTLGCTATLGLTLLRYD